MRLEGRTCLVTGAAGGIGTALTHRFLDEGARVIATDLDPEALREHYAARASDDRLHLAGLDITKAEQIAALVAELEGSGRAPDVLINNAAAIRIGALLDAKPEDLDLVYGVNMRGTMLVTRAVLPGMIARGGGTVLNMASLAGVHAMYERFAYGASKAAIVMMTRSIAVDYVARGIRANCICAARVATPFVRSYLEEYYPGEVEERFDALSRYQPTGRMIQADEVAQMAVYLCSAESAMVNGQSFVMDGGVTAGDRAPAAQI
ncbi:SDR family NAD(P)-dependent oxidoreductase [Pseudoroseicyclus sp. CXY001]|uniref:SDR family NAD(P)-dependent oxidoreductase n=1 Tax=Pseudoroseicyclus sp. CXY001 TaxID=3242492 RepID=UPI00358DA26D